MRINKFLVVGFIIFSYFINAQTVQQGAPPPANNTNAQANSAWYRGGNNFGQTNPPGANIFGTLWNSPIYTQTFGINRMKLNGTFGVAGVPQYTIDGLGAAQGVNTSGYLLLGQNSNTGNGLLYDGNRGAYSLLHLNGNRGGQSFGYRPWMQTGITFTSNDDLSYFGHRQVGTGFDVTETMISWSDNNTNNFGPDDMAFRFTGGIASPNNPSYNNDFSQVNDLDGLHISRFTGEGRMGLGNSFGVNAPGAMLNYASPQSLLHMSYQFRQGAQFQPYGFMQITYRRPNGAGGDITGQGEQATDGLRFGINNNIFTTGGQPYLNAYLRWQENSSFIIQTDDGAPSNINNNERLRITSVGSLVNNFGNNYLGITGPTNLTRIAISADGANPITRPMSLLHLGFNVGLNALTPNTVDGWRSWMDIGTFTSNGTDNIYVGLKNEGQDRFDAVINWGDNQINSGLGNVNGPDHLRFIFTSSATPFAQGDSVSISQNGLETGRFVPGLDTNNVPDVYGKFGVGDFTAKDVSHKLHVRGNGRFEYVPNDTIAQYLILGHNDDTTNVNDVSLRKLAFPNDSNLVLLGNGTWGNGAGSVFANNGLSILNDTVQLGQEILGGNLAFTGAAELLNDREIPLNGYDLVYSTNPTQFKNRIFQGFYIDDYTPLLGTTANPSNPIPNIAGSHISAKHNVINFTETSSAYFLNVMLDSNLVNTKAYHTIGAIGQVLTPSPISGDLPEKIGLLGVVNGANGGKNIGVKGWSSEFGQYNYGLMGRSYNASVRNYGGFMTSNGAFANTNYGSYNAANGASSKNIGVYGTASGPVGSTNWAGYFDGNVYASGSFTSSDQNLKENIDSLQNANQLLNQLNPVSFNFKTNDYPYLHLQEGEQMGLIAQEVETILPSIVKEISRPADLDSVGNIINAELNYKTVDYTKLIPILIAGHQEQSKTIDSVKAQNTTLANELNSKDSLIDDLNARLSKLEACLSNILPALCQINQTMIQSNSPQVQNEVRQQLSVILSNKDAIILDQNVPNPFAEQTVINFSIPESVAKAQIHFYNGEGKLMQSVDVNERGLGSLTVFGADLSKGVYTYTLVADGQIVATKRMVKQ